jgi:hypothetical protein
VEVLDAKTAGGAVMRFFVDAKTHLPLVVSWSDTAMFMATTTSVVAVGPGGRTASSPSSHLPDPPTNIPTVEYRLAFDDYRTADGLTWPHRIRKFMAGQRIQEIRLGKFKINPKINDRKFDVTK